MHFMSESATTRRGRRSTELRIAEAAQRLADERGGLDGFTMDDLAAAAEVSRRTLFNYFPGKVDAVLGPETDLPPDALAAFVGGGPTGDLVEDLKVLVMIVLASEEFDAEVLARFERLLHANPVLLLGMKQRLHRLGERVVDAATSRPGNQVSTHDAHVAVAVLAAMADVAVTRFLEHPDQDLAEHYAHAFSALRRVFG